VAEYIGSLDSEVKAVYTYEPDQATDADCMATNQPALSPAINMIAWVEHRSAALASVVDMLRSAVSEELRPLVCPKANALCTMLDFQVVDDDEVTSRRGYGALITSIYVRPLEVWRR
jgi:hypothetical protein